MGLLNLKEEKEISKFISSMLDRRGLYLDTKDEWEVHGPHQDMDYQVYVGLTYDKKTEDCFYVAIYPRAVYWIDDYIDWWKTGPENRITV